MPRVRASLWMLPALLLAIPACRSSDRGAAASPPEDFALTFGEGGGFTGQWSGQTVRPDGVVLRWQGRAAEENGMPAGSLTDERRRALWSELQQLDFADAAAANRPKGDLIRFLKVTANGQTRTITWTPQMAPPGEAPARAPLAEFYERCLEATSNLTPDSR